MRRTSLKERLIGLLTGVTMVCLGSLLAWSGRATFLGVLGNSFLAFVGGTIAMVGLFVVVRSGAMRYVMTLGGAGFFLWSLWTVLSGGSATEAVKFGFWFGPLCMVIGFFISVWEAPKPDTS